MKFTLHYQGPLKSDGKPDHKNDIRNVFHRQLKILWSQPPLSEYAQKLLQPRTKVDYCLLRELGEHIFIPLITKEMNAIAELDVTLLRPEAPGDLLTQGGDIDNRLKTLFDSLTMPRHLNALPKNWNGNDSDDPHTYCLLEDDNLVIDLKVKTVQLLEPDHDSSFVDVQISVTTGVTRATMGNMEWS